MTAWYDGTSRSMAYKWREPRKDDVYVIIHYVQSDKLDHVSECGSI